MNTIYYLPEAVRYMQVVFPWAYPRPRRKRHLDRISRFLHGSLVDIPTDRATDNATRSVTMGGAHSGEAKFRYCLWLQQVILKQSTQKHHDWLFL